MRRPFAGFVFGCCSLILLVGCSGSGGTRVKGKASLDGQPLTDAEVVIESGDKSNMGKFSGKTDEKGEFEIPPPGVPGTIKPGKYRVLFSKFVDKKGKTPNAEEYGQLQARGALKNIIPPEYSDIAFSDLSVEVKEGINTPPPFDLKSKGGKK
jgi:hypothetical protein